MSTLSRIPDNTAFTQCLLALIDVPSALAERLEKKIILMISLEEWTQQ
jgi:hypothetical protein